MQLINSIKSLLGIDTKALAATSAKISITAYNQIYPTWTSYREIAAYKTLDDIFSVVTRLARNSAAITIYGYNANGEDLPESDKLAAFLRTVTYVKKLELYTWLYLRGECFIYKDKTLGVNGQVNSIHFINPSYITLILTDTFPETIAQYWYRDNQRGIELFFEADEMIFIKNFNPSEDFQYSWRGLSPVVPLLQRLTRIESNMRNSVGQMQNGGVPGVMYQKDLPSTAASKTVIDGNKDNFGRYAKNPENKGAPYITSGDWGYFTIGSSLVDLASLDMEELDFKKICNAWQISARLFNIDGTGSEISDDNAQIGMYTNAIIPTVTMVEDAFNTQLANDFGVGVRIMKHDLDSILILQQIKWKKAKFWGDLPMYIPNSMLRDIGEATIDDPMMDEPLFKSGYVPKDQLEPLPPIDQPSVP